MFLSFSFEISFTIFLMQPFLLLFPSPLFLPLTLVSFPPSYAFCLPHPFLIFSCLLLSSLSATFIHHSFLLLPSYVPLLPSSLFPFPLFFLPGLFHLQRRGDTGDAAADHIDGLAVMYAVRH